ncbi:serine protease Do [Pedobacter africanus]|uniref:S1-C subfamily serine protease n=1 Tax=Pedobacter africanus TaxID=151894 RepID=A0ACC6L1P5_9SPHI|nr:serine protease [Pedobacter africanus]MDR6785238.1 S1-C subfamily serine protease [Pedobacter africanus]
MNITSLKTQLLSIVAALLINCCLLFTAAAQNTSKLISVDDATLVSKIEKQAETAMSDRNWVIDRLKNKIQNLKEGDRVTASLPKAATKLMSSEDIYEQRSKGVIMVGSYYNCGNCNKMHTSLASGAILNDQGICVTNYHVLEKIIDAKQRAKAGDSLAFVSTMDGRIFPITDILAYTKIGDAAIFKIDTKGEKLSSIPLGQSAKTGARVHAITHPNGYHYFYSEGVVARNVSYATNGADGDRMEITADYAKGSSGGPILDSYGNLIGMVSTTSSIYYDEQKGTNLQMVVKSTIPVATIKRLFNGPQTT